MMLSLNYTGQNACNYSDKHTEKYRSFRSNVNLLFSTALPQIAALPETKEVTVGSDAVLPCVASGYPVPQIKWSKVTKIPKKNQFSRWNLLFLNILVYN